MGAKTVSGVTLGGGFVVFSHHGASEARGYRVPLGQQFTDRESGDNWTLHAVELEPDARATMLREWGELGHRRMSLATLPYAFDLEPYRTAGPPLRTAVKHWTRKEGVPAVVERPAPQIATPGKEGERPQPSGVEHAAPAVEEESTPPVLADHGPGSAASPPARAALARVLFDGDYLEATRLPGDGPDDGWVSLPSLLRPFGKRTDHAAGLLEGWARTRVEVVAPLQAGTNGDARAKSTTLLHFRDAPLVIARLEQRGMDGDTKKKHARYLRGCADVLAAFLFGGPSPLPPTPHVEPIELVRAISRENAKVLAEALAPMVRRIDAMEERERRRAEGDPPGPHAPALPDVPAGGTASLGDGRTLHVAPHDAFSQRAAAARLGLPQEGTGARALGILADLERVWEDPALHRMVTWLGGTGRTNEHRLLTEAGVEAVRLRAKRYLAHVNAVGWYVTGGDGRLAAGAKARAGLKVGAVHRGALEFASEPARPSQMRIDA